MKSTIISMEELGSSEQPKCDLCEEIREGPSEKDKCELRFEDVEKKNLCKYLE